MFYEHNEVNTFIAPVVQVYSRDVIARFSLVKVMLVRYTYKTLC